MYSSRCAVFSYNTGFEPETLHLDSVSSEIFFFFSFFQNFYNFILLICSSRLNEILCWFLVTQPKFYSSSIFFITLGPTWLAAIYHVVFMPSLIFVFIISLSYSVLLIHKQFLNPKSPICSHIYSFKKVDKNEILENIVL